MKCLNCGCELPEGSKFCFSCGIKQPEETNIQPEETDIQPEKELEIPEVTVEMAEVDAALAEQEKLEQQESQEQAFGFCPYCGGKNEGDAVFCSSCGNKMNIVGAGGEIVPHMEPKRRARKLVIFAVAVVAVAAAIVAAVTSIGGKENNYVAYLKEGKVTQADLENYKKDPVEYPGNYGESTGQIGGVQYSADGKYICYPTELDSAVYRLNMQEVGKEEEPVKIDNSVCKYTLLDNNKVVYIKAGNNVLYISNWKAEKEKVASDVLSYQIDEKQENIVWIEQNDGYSIYQQDIRMKKDKKTLAKNVDSFKISPNFKQIVVLEEDTLYVIENFGEKEKISSDVQQVVSQNEETGRIYYTKNTQDIMSAMDFVEDDCIDSDDSIKEPKIEDFMEEVVEKNSFTGKYEKVEKTDAEAYNKAYTEYRKKENRENLRNQLKEQEISNTIQALYAYENGKETLIEENFMAKYYANTSDILVFIRYQMEQVEKVKLSQIEYTSEVEGKYWENLYQACQTCLYTGETLIPLKEYLSEGVRVDDKANIGYGMVAQGEGENKTYTLVSFSTKESSDGTCTTVAEDVASIEGIKNGGVYYTTDAKNGEGDLWYNGEAVDTDVKQNSLYLTEKSAVYITDYDGEKLRGTLKLFNGKKGIKIADDVFCYQIFNDKKIALLVDYSTKSLSGDLKFYRGKEELVNLDEDVSMIFGGNQSILNFKEETEDGYFW